MPNLWMKMKALKRHVPFVGEGEEFSLFLVLIQSSSFPNSLKAFYINAPQIRGGKKLTGKVSSHLDLGAETSEMSLELDEKPKDSLN